VYFKTHKINQFMLHGADKIDVARPVILKMGSRANTGQMNAKNMAIAALFSKQLAARSP